ncbi:MAG: ATP-dependent DNA helicase RecG [Gammaproteobacteria bacterium]|nr:ATP-dependent DNA helicase RecG [Gammaproteobacteria bacterium]
MVDSLVNLPVETLEGIGKIRRQQLSRLGIKTIWDLLLHLPIRYENRCVVTAIEQLRHGQEPVVIQGVIERNSTTRGARPRFDCLVNDASGSVFLRFFNHYPGQQQRFASGQWIRCYGRVTDGFEGLEMIHPEYDIVAGEENLPALPDKLNPVYPITQGLTQQVLRSTVQQALQRIVDCQELFDPWIKLIPEHLQALSLTDIFHSIHYPELGDIHQAVDNFGYRSSGYFPRQRLALEEILVSGYQARQLYRQQCGHAVVNIDAEQARLVIAALLNTLPFEATAAQTRAIQDIIGDYTGDIAMQRLVQGDVGSGKTLVAACAVLPIVHAGGQVAILAPTELLAEQHLTTMQTWFNNQHEVRVTMVMLKGGQTAVLREQVLTEIGNGGANLVIGTHALLSDPVVFNQLALVIIDEQHRFGVEQRAKLLKKQQQQGKRPHLLVMTATPIPRTQALLQYAGLNVSIIDELPSGRLPVTTVALSTKRRHEIQQRIIEWVELGRQVYWVCTVIEENDDSNRESLQSTYTSLCSEVPEVRFGLLHGKMSNHDKQSVMEQFRQQQFDVLVATTVIEVGVDVSNANLMIIEDADKLGLAQLHQLRGRVGRSKEQGYCVLLYHPPLTDVARQRLGLLRECQDGFEIAEKDLQLRGPGELVGYRQSGDISFRVADLAVDTDLLNATQHILDIMHEQNLEISEAVLQRWISAQFIEQTILEA